MNVEAPSEGPGEEHEGVCHLLESVDKVSYYTKGKSDGCADHTVSC